MQSRDLQAKFPEVMRKLRTMSDGGERTSKEHIHLYSCYAEIIKAAVTQDDINLAEEHIVRAKRWFEHKLLGTEFRN